MMTGNRFCRALTVESSRQQFAGGQILNVFVALHGTNRCTLQEAMTLLLVAILVVMVMMMMPIIVIPAAAIRCCGRGLGHNRSRDHGAHPNDVSSRTPDVFSHSPSSEVELTI